MAISHDIPSHPILSYPILWDKMHYDSSLTLRQETKPHEMHKHNWLQIAVLEMIVIIIFDFKSKFGQFQMLRPSDMVVFIIYLPQCICLLIEECVKPKLKDETIVINGRGHLTRLPDAMLPEFKRVFIYNGNIPIIPSNGFRNWKHVIALKLISNNISTINPGAFTNMGSLYALTISQNRLTRIPNGTFCPTQWCIRSITLSYNKLADIQAGSFKCLDYLSHLTLSFNQLTNLTWDVFLDTPNLQWLDVRNNQLAHFKGDISVLNKVIFIHLEGNVALPLHQLSKIMHSSDNIYLSNSHLKDIYVDVNVSNQVLKQPFFLETNYSHQFSWIDLSYNEITRLESVREICNISKYSHRRTHLDLHHNSLIALPAFAFCFYKRFKVIILTSNKIAVIDVNSFSGIEHLEYVKIDGNRLVLLVFTELPPAGNLRVGDNHLIEVPILAKESLALTDLYLKNNKVSYTGFQSM